MAKLPLWSFILRSLFDLVPSIFIFEHLMYIMPFVEHLSYGSNVYNVLTRYLWYFSTKHLDSYINICFDVCKYIWVLQLVSEQVVSSTLP